MAIFPSLDMWQWLVGPCVIVGTSICYEVAHRMWLGPLSKFPGPRIAALTGWQETYFDCFKRGCYWVEIEKMHEKYGEFIDRQRVRETDDDRTDCED